MTSLYAAESVPTPASQRFLRKRVFTEAMVLYRETSRAVSWALAIPPTKRAIRKRFKDARQSVVEAALDAFVAYVHRERGRG